MIAEHPTERIPEIDALRALAVVAVVLFHFFPTVFPNGYLGVDAFFVISGFVVMRRYAREPTRGFIRFVTSFYRRRFWRIFPSLAAVTLVGMVLVVMFDPASERSTRTGLWGLVGLANIQLFMGSENYFIEQTGTNAFTHFWSLGVEEQFYFLFPLLMYAVLYSKRKVTAVTAIAAPTSISFIVYLLFTERGSINASFYLLPFRFWEIGCGAILALIPLARIKENSRLAKLIGAPWLLVSLFLPSSMRTTLATTSTVFATSSFILGTTIPSKHFQQITQLLAIVGRRAYSLYLTHWVVLVLFRLTIGTEGVRSLIAIATTVVLSECNHRLVEQRFMKSDDWRAARARSAGVFAATALLLSVSLSVKGESFYLGHVRDAGASTLRNSCNDESSGRWLVGDSHADRYANILGTYFEGDCFQLRDSSTGYGFLFDLDGGSKRNVVFRDTKEFEARLQKFQPKELWISNYLQGLFQEPELVRRSADWTIRSYILSDGRRTTDNEYGFSYLLSEYREILREANLVGTRVFVELPPPDFDWIGQGGLMWRDEGSMCAVNWFSPNRQSEFQEVCDFYKMPSNVSRGEVESRRHSIVNGLRQLDDEFGNLTLIDPLEVLCSTSTCSTHRNGVRLFEDDDHYSVAGELLMVARLKDLLR